MLRKILMLVVMIGGLFGTINWSIVWAQRETTKVDWKVELAKARSAIEKNPKSAFWHNQAGVAYDALGDFDNAVTELKLAAALDSTNPMHDYALYALYKRKKMAVEERDVLLSALEKDAQNPLGRYEFAALLDQEGHTADALREYQVARKLVAIVEGHEYIDPRGNPYDIDFIRKNVDKCISRILKLSSAKDHKD